MYFSFYPSTTVSFHHALEVRTQLSSPPSVPFKKIFAGLLFLGRAEWFGFFVFHGVLIILARNMRLSTCKNGYYCAVMTRTQ